MLRAARRRAVVRRLVVFERRRRGSPRAGTGGRGGPAAAASVIFLIWWVALRASISGPERPALDRLGQDRGRRAVVLGGGLVGRVELAVVVAAAGQVAEVVVGEVLDQLPQPRVGAEEVLADVGAGLDRVLLELAVDGRVHLVEQDAVDVAGQQLVPLRAPDDLDHVPAGAAEHRLELLDDLAVAADRAVEPLQVAVDDEDQVVELLAAGQRQGTEASRARRTRRRRGSTRPGCRRCRRAAVVEVAVEAGLVDGADRAEAHRDRRELPEVGHQARVRVRRQPAAAARGPTSIAEVVELLLGQPALEEGAGVDARRGVALEEDLVARPCRRPCRGRNG